MNVAKQIRSAGSRARGAPSGERLMIRYWLTMDFGARYNVKGLFEWLDSVNAQECGLFGATFLSEKLREEVAEELKVVAGAGGSMRLYLIGRKAPNGPVSGGFILGSRRSASWEGFAAQPQAPEEEDR